MCVRERERVSVCVSLFEICTIMHKSNPHVCLSDAFLCIFLFNVHLPLVCMYMHVPITSITVERNVLKIGLNEI